MRKLLSVFFLILIVGLTSCQKKEKRENEIEVTFWGSIEEIKIMQKLASEWNSQHKDIKIVLQHIPTGNYVQKILTRIAGGDPPDIIFSEVNDFVMFNSKNIFLDLSQFIKKDKEFSLDKFFPQIIKRFKKGESIYLIPRDIAPFACVYYNKDLFRKKGVPFPTDDWKWKDLLEKAKKLTETKDGKTVCYGFYTIFWENFVYSSGGGIVDNPDNPKKCILNSKKSLRGLQFYYDLIHKYHVMPSPEVMVGMQMGALQMFMSGKLAMYGSGIWEVPLFRKIKTFSWDIVMFPKGPEGIRAFGSGGSGYGILKTCKNPSYAWEVLKFLTGEKAQKLLAESGLAQPSNIEIARNFFAKSPLPPENKKMLNEAVKYVVFEPDNPKWREAKDKYLNQTLELIFNGQLPLKRGINEAVKKINSFLFSLEPGS